MYTALSGNKLSPMLSTVPAYFGKFSLVWPAIACLYGNPDIYSKIRNFGLKSSSKDTIYFVVRFKIVKSVKPY
jgi:hypothetical protein